MQVGQQASQQHEWMAVCSRGSWQASLCSIGIGCDVRAPYGSAIFQTQQKQMQQSVVVVSVYRDGSYICGCKQEQ